MKVYRYILVHIGLLLSTYALAQPIIPQLGDLGVRAYILLEANSGKVLAAQNEHTRLPPASLTKIMTSYLVAEELAAGRLNHLQTLRVSRNAWEKGGPQTGGSTMFLRERSKVSIGDLLKGMIIQSGNDAAIVLAEHISGSEDGFASLMNYKANMLGMTNTNFVNSTGWPANNHYTTAYDIGILSRALVNDFPKHYELYSHKEFTYSGIRQNNRNLLLWQDSTIDGIKTGSTEEAGYALVASALRNNMRLISVVLGAGSVLRRNEASKRLLSWGYRYYSLTEMYAKDEMLDVRSVWQGQRNTLKVGLADALHVVLPRSKKNNVEVIFLHDDYLEAPIQKGEIVGKFTVLFEGESIHEGELISLEKIERGSFFKRTWDTVRYYFLQMLD